ncbi:pilus assembly protein [bacterium]|nr:pilus assembly protein [bacterium]
MRNKVHTTIHGYSLLEVALSLPILLVLMIGAYDANTAFHGYTALREGVESANRCTWTTEGGCTTFSTSEPSPPYFNWTAFVPSMSEYYGYQYQYYGTEYHLLRPQFEVGNYQAYSLGTRSFEYASNLRRFAQLRFPAEGIRPRIFQSISPHLNIARIPGGRPQVSATYIGGGGNYSNNIPYTLNGSPSLQWNGARNGTVSFTLGAPSGLDECRISENFDGAGSHTPSTADCSSSAAYRPNRGFVSLVVYGTDANSQTGSSGQIQMRISGPGLQGQVPLGARAYGYGDDASFCPRVPNLPSPNAPGSSSYVTTDIATCAESIPGTYAGFRRLRFGETYTLHFSLVGVTGGDLQWSFDGLELFLPRISGGWNNWRECVGGILPSDYHNRSGCTVPNGRLAPEVRWVNQASQPNNSTGQQSVFTPPGADTPAGEAAHPLEHRFSASEKDTITSAPCSVISTYLPNTFCDDWYEIPSIPISGMMTQACSENLGTAIHEIEGGSLEEINLELAFTECGPPEESVQLYTVSVGPEEIDYELQTHQFSNIPSMIWEPATCNDAEPPIPAEVLQYPHHSYSESSYGYGPPFHLAPTIDPRIMITTPAYSCSRSGIPYTVATVLYDEHTTSQNFFQELHFEHEVGCAEDEWGLTVRANAIDAGMNPLAFMEAGKLTPTFSVGSSVQGIKAAVSESIFNQYATAECEMEMVPGQPLQPVGSLEGSCQNPLHTQPATLCENSDVVCIRELAGFCGAQGDGVSPSVSLLEAEAQQHFFSTLKQIYPAAQFGCTGSNCAQFGAPQGYDPNNPGTLSQWEGTLQVPLLSARLLNFLIPEEHDLFGAGRLSFSLGAKNARRFERDLID